MYIYLYIYSTRSAQAHIFRLSGIYGPGRSALDTVRKSLLLSSLPGGSGKGGDSASAAAGGYPLYMPKKKTVC